MPPAPATLLRQALKPEWREWVLAEMRRAWGRDAVDAMSDESCEAHLFLQFLHSNVKHSLAAPLPLNVAETTSTTLSGMHFVQASKLQAINLSHEARKNKASNARSTLKLTLTDGVSSFYALE